MSDALGHHVLLELYGCDAGVIDNPVLLASHLLEALVLTGATVIEHHFHHFSPQGVSGVVLIAESHLTIHTWPEHRYAAVDLFTCGTKLRSEPCVRHLEKALGASSSSAQEIARGLTRQLAPAPAADRSDAGVGQLHPSLYRYDRDFVARFIAPGVATATPARAREVVTELAEQVYRFQLFTPELCRLLIEECEQRAAWKTVLEKIEEPHSTQESVGDLIEPETAVSWEEMPGLVEVYRQIIEHHVRPVLEGLWPTFKLQKWDTPAVRKFEPHVVAGMDLHYDAETVGMIGYLSEGFEGGGTHFPRWGLTVGRSGEVQLGSVIVYPGGISHEHLAFPVTRGTRYMLSNSFY